MYLVLPHCDIIVNSVLELIFSAIDKDGVNLTLCTTGLILNYGQFSHNYFLALGLVVNSPG